MGLCLVMLGVRALSGLLEGGESIEFGTDVCHAAADAKAASLARLDQMEDAQRAAGRATGTRVIRSDLHSRWRYSGGGRLVGAVDSVRGPRCPLGAAATRQPAGELLQGGKQRGGGKEGDSHVKPFRRLEVGHRQDSIGLRDNRVWRPAVPRRPPPDAARIPGWGSYMSMVLRIRPTASPSISKGSPGSTTMVL